MPPIGETKYYERVHKTPLVYGFPINHVYNGFILLLLFKIKAFVTWTNGNI